MATLWDIGKGEDKDQSFIKTAAVMIFGSKHMLQVGVVKGVASKGIKREGLDIVALEGIRGKWLTLLPLKRILQSKLLKLKARSAYVILLFVSVLLILRAHEEGVDVKWDTPRTKQSVVNRAITDKTKTLKISALTAKVSATGTPEKSSSQDVMED